MPIVDRHVLFPLMLHHVELVIFDMDPPPQHHHHERFFVPMMNEMKIEIELVRSYSCSTFCDDDDDDSDDDDSYSAMKVWKEDCCCGH
jgi:hypothetical protein